MFGVFRHARNGRVDEAARQRMRLLSGFSLTFRDADAIIAGLPANGATYPMSSTR
jgi:hypothetical protein